MDKIIFTVTLLCCLSLSGCHVISMHISDRQTTASNFTKPRHVHLSLGALPSQMVVTWSTLNDTAKSVVYYGIISSHIRSMALGGSTKFVDGGKLVATQYIHRVTLKDLKPGQSYNYSCGSGNAAEMSRFFTFKVVPSGQNWAPRFVVYGDMGVLNAQSMPRLKDDIIGRSMYDAVLHVGDFAYDMADNNGATGDAFMEMIEPIAAHVPYMTTPGNHEHHYNFSNYKNRFSMPGGDGQGMFYSYNMGPVHVISMSTEFYFYIYYGIEQIARQFSWLEQDLKEATKPENRALHPWIVFMGHRPLYCSNDNRDCILDVEILRNGVPLVHWYGLDDLLHRYGVDLGIWAHEHSYERLWPVWDDKIWNGSLAAPYTNPKATVHIITGSAGCKEDHDKFRHKVRPYSAFHSTDYGYSRMTVYNASHLYWEQVSDDQGGKVIDRMWLIKDKHEPF